MIPPLRADATTANNLLPEIRFPSIDSIDVYSSRREAGERESLLIRLRDSEECMRFMAQHDALNGLPIPLEGGSWRITCSIGICLFPDHAESAAALLAFADQAMYEAKGDTRARVTFYAAAA